ncbi:PREDICTED: organic cation transporter protein-like [Priapulus caudatus]|uniref:Organic cation transporter protein-like n=1 Tax=Priapulus caudatus TaxID=37621 RepID=A0ABM1EIR4_PRICU|nr:PREDICTED: organic cation transporter protein-like [Priapulus caudatus]
MAGKTMDRLLQMVGPGWYQVAVYILLCLNYIPVNNNHTIMAFFGLPLSHRCKVPENLTTTLPSMSQVAADTCHLNVTTYTGDNSSELSRVKCPGQWEYDRGDPGPLGFSDWTIASEWDLVCDQRFLASLATTIYFVGVMFGGVVFGALADAFGRKPVMLGCLYAQMFVCLAIYFSQGYVMFVALRFVLGFLLQGLQSTSFILIMEMFMPEHRTIVGTIVECFWALGNMWLAFLGFLFRDWHYIQLAVTLPSILAIGYIWLIPESLRWLIVNGKVESAKQVAEKAVKYNRVKVVHSYLHDTIDEVAAQTSKSDDTEPTRRYTVLDMLRTPMLRRRALSMFYIWFATSLVYYGLLLNIGKLSGDKYLNYFISACIEMVTYVIAIFLISRFGRPKPLVGFFLTAGISCIFSVALPDVIGDFRMQNVKTGFAFLGRCGVSGCFSVIFMYTSELFPTVIRTVALGACLFWARFGGVVAPQINLLDSGTGFQRAPSIAFGCIAIVGAVIAFFLPETLHRRLPDTLEEAERLESFHQETSYDSVGHEMVDQSDMSERV